MNYKFLEMIKVYMNPKFMTTYEYVHIPNKTTYEYSDSKFHHSKSDDT